MKNDQQTFHYGVEDKQWELNLTQEFTRLKEEAGETGKDQAVNLIPPVDCKIEESKPYNGSIIQNFQLLIDQNAKHLQVESQRQKVDRLRADADYQLEITSKEKNTVVNDYRVEKREYEKKGIRNILPALQNKRKKLKRIMPLVLLIVVTDALVSSSVLQQLNYPLWTALLIGVSISAGLFVLSHQMPSMIHKAKSRFAKIAVVLGVFIAVSLIFSAFASFRASSGMANSLYFILINLFSFGSASILVYNYSLTPKEKEQLNSFGAMQDSLNALQKQKEVIEQKEATIRASITKAEEQYQALHIYAKNVEQTIVSSYCSTYQFFIEQNVFHRSDQQVPTFFHDKAPNLDIKFKTNTP